MADVSTANGDTTQLVITIAGLGPGNIDRVPDPVRTLLLDPDRTIVLRTLDHPAARQLAAQRTVVSCDDLYEAAETFDDVYQAIVARVLSEARSGPVVYAVPGSPLVGEFAVRKLLDSDESVDVIPGESFIDAILAEVGYDPMDRGLQILDGHDLPDPLILDKPTIIGQMDSPEVIADVGAAVDRVTVEGSEVIVVANLGSDEAVVSRSAASSLDVALAGYRTSLFVDAEPGGLVGVIRAMRTLRMECPWDREQTHGSLAKYLVEETHELIDAIVGLEASPDDLVSYAAVEDELGDVLLSVLFHAVIAREARAFDIDDVSEALRQKLVRRHPHVFGEVEVGSASEVKANWDRIKADETPGSDEGSALDGVPTGMPALQRAAKVQNRAAKVGFDWNQATDVIGKVGEEIEELAEAMSADGDVPGELGDLLFSVVNLSRHLNVDPELALAAATRRFEDRFRKMESDGPLNGLSPDELDRRWERAKLDQ